MGKKAEAPGPVRSEDAEKLAVQVGHLKKAVVLLMGLCLVTSLSLNIYLQAAYRATTTAVDLYRRQADDQGELWRLYKRLIIDLRSLSRTDQAVKDLLVKYRIPDEAVSDTTRGTSLDERLE